MILQALFPFLLVAQGVPVKLSPDTFDLTGQSSVVVTSDLDLNGAVILSRSLVKSDTFFVFTLVGGTIRNGTIIGANGDTDVPEGSGYMGGVRIRTVGRIDRVNFVNLNKWGVDIRGDRKTLTDTSYITNCNFKNIRINSFGYGLWNQYGTAIIDSCNFINLRHGTDGGSEAHRTIITNSTFERCSQSGIHNHLYNSGCSGSGTIVSKCYFASNSIDVDLEPAFYPFINSITDTVRWDGVSTGFWIKSLGTSVAIYNGSILDETLKPNTNWEYYHYRFYATIRISGNGTCYIDDFIQPKANRYFLHEDGKAPKIRYITPGGKADKSNADQVSGDKSLRIRLESGQVLEVY